MSSSTNSSHWQPMQCSVHWVDPEQDAAMLSFIYRSTLEDESRNICLRFSGFEGQYYLLNSMTPKIYLNLEPESHRFQIGDLEPTTSSSRTLDLAYHWFSDCQCNHARCRRPSTNVNWLPTRLLDIGTSRDDQWRLCLTSEDCLQSSSYVTLSYRWGDSPRFMLVDENIGKCRNGQLIRDLPQTFQHAIIVTRRLAIRYLWIDSLCIIQDSKKDWEEESAKMHLVYTHACCNIAASASRHPEEGLFRSRNTEGIVPEVVAAEIPGFKKKQHVVLDWNYWARHVSNQPLHQRGWVFQERVLAPRVLYFSEHQVLWECFTTNKSEGLPFGIPLDFSLKRSDLVCDIVKGSATLENYKWLFIFNTWNHFVEEYTKCSLTEPSDKLVALSGIAKVFQAFTGDEYLAGLWRARLREHLNWKVFEPVAKLPLDFRAPSWSWAKLDAPVQTKGLSAVTCQFLSVLHAEVNASTVDRTGRVYAGHLVVKGRVFGATCYTFNQEKSSYRLKSEIDSNATIRFYPDAVEEIPGAGAKVLCIVLCSNWLYWKDIPDKLHLEGLVLNSTGSSPGNYQRIGHFTLEEEENLLSHGFRRTPDDFVTMDKTTPLSTITIF